MCVCEYMHARVNLYDCERDSVLKIRGNLCVKMVAFLEMWSNKTIL